MDRQVAGRNGAQQAMTFELKADGATLTLAPAPSLLREQTQSPPICHELGEFVSARGAGRRRFG